MWTAENQKRRKASNRNTEMRLIIGRERYVKAVGNQGRKENPHGYRMREGSHTIRFRKADLISWFFRVKLLPRNFNRKKRVGILRRTFYVVKDFTETSWTRKLKLGDTIPYPAPWRDGNNFPIKRKDTIHWF